MRRRSWVAGHRSRSDRGQGNAREWLGDVLFVVRVNSDERRREWDPITMAGVRVLRFVQPTQPDRRSWRYPSSCPTGFVAGLPSSQRFLARRRQRVQTRTQVKVPVVLAAVPEIGHPAVPVQRAKRARMAPRQVSWSPPCRHRPTRRSQLQSPTSQVRGQGRFVHAAAAATGAREAVNSERGGVGGT